MTHLDKCKIPELKAIAKKYNLKISGTKPLLLQRIREHLYRDKCATIAQKVFRGHMVRFLYFHASRSYKSINLCVNECDSCTLEPVISIPYFRFYTIVDDKNAFVYGFDILSLLTLFKKCGNVNPYTREPMNDTIVNTANTLGRLLLILLPDMIDKSEREIIDMYSPYLGNTRRHSTPPVRLYRPQYTFVANDVRNTIFNNIHIHPLQSDIDELLMNNHEYFTVVEYNLIVRLVNIRKLPLEQRIREMFIEIDLLGNYTHFGWFADLTTHEYFQFFSHLYNLWNYRAGLSREIKQQICILYNPFTYLNIDHDAFIDHDKVKEICTTIAENIVYGGQDPEYRKLGCMHVLSALTLVSREARQNLYWLYESL